MAWIGQMVKEADDHLCSLLVTKPGSLVGGFRSWPDDALPKDGKCLS